MTQKAGAPGNTRFVDQFIGCDSAALPKPEGIAKSWWCAKPPVGNTHPGATLPFGMVSVCAYSGGYVTGYGPYDLSLGGSLKISVVKSGHHSNNRNRSNSDLLQLFTHHPLSRRRANWFGPKVSPHRRSCYSWILLWPLGRVRRAL